MEPRSMVREGFAYGGQGRRDFQEQYGVLETVERIEDSDNACSRATKKTVRVLRKPGASPLLFGKFLMNTTAFLALEDISDNLPRYDESVISVDMDATLQQAYERLEEEIRSAMQEHRGNKSLMSILLNTLLLYPDHPYDFEEIWARAFDPQTKEFARFLVATPENLSREALYAKERALVADIKEELRQGRRCQIYATYTGEKDVTHRLETVLQQEGVRVAVLRSSVPTDKREDWYERQLKAGTDVVICHPKLVETGLDLLAFRASIERDKGGERFSDDGADGANDDSGGVSAIESQTTFSSPVAWHWQDDHVSQVAGDKSASGLKEAKMP
jgi:hypothetical protein